MLTAACFAAGPAVAQDLHPQDMTCENFLILMLAGIAWNYCENPASGHYYALSPEGLDRTDRDPWGAGIGCTNPPPGSPLEPRPLALELVVDDHTLPIGPMAVEIMGNLYAAWGDEHWTERNTASPQHITVVDDPIEVARLLDNLEWRHKMTWSNPPPPGSEKTYAQWIITLHLILPTVRERCAR